MKRPGLNNESGAALLTVLVIAVIGAIVGMAAVKSTTRTVKVAGHSRARVNLLNIAEAGKEHALARLRSGEVTPSEGASEEIVPLTDFGGGQYRVDYTANGDASTLWLTSTASYQDMSRAIEVTVEVTLCDPNPAFDYLILVDGAFAHENFGDLNFGPGGKAHVNGPAKFEGEEENQFTVTGDVSAVGNLKFEYCTLDGDATAPDVEDEDGEVTGAVTETAVETVDIPEFDWMPCFNIADANNEVVEGNYTEDGAFGTLAPDGGVLWVNGNVLFEGGATGTIHGCIIATGYIKIESNNDITQQKYEDFPAFVSTGSYVKKEVQGASLTVEGLIYAETDVLLENNGSLTGSIMCKGDCRIENNWTMNYENTSDADPNSSGGCSGSSYTVSEWREL